MKTSTEENDRTTLAPTEWHPSADAAWFFIRQIPLPKLLLIRESLASCAIEGNRAAEVCLGTLNRILNNQPISDRYLLGLAWFLKMSGESDGSVDPEAILLNEARSIMQRSLLNVYGDNWRDDAANFIKGGNKCLG